MLVKYFEQNDIVNLDQVSFIRASEDGNDFYIKFYTVVPQKANYETSIPTKPATSHPFASWRFNTQEFRDAAIKDILEKSGGIIFQ